MKTKTSLALLLVLPASILLQGCVGTIDRMEDRYDRREDRWDRRHYNGPADVREDYWDKRENFNDKLRGRRALWR